MSVKIPQSFKAFCATENDVVNYDIPTFQGKTTWKELFSQYGLPNAAPQIGESYFGNCRVLFVDDFDDGKPVAYWIPKKK